jgi:hypothetical protein
MNESIAAILRGAAAGLLAGIPQVAIVQVVEKPLGLPSDQADIGPRFVQRLAEHLGEPLSAGPKWGLAALFHFAYSVWWGALYGLADALVRPPPAVAGPLLGGVIYAAAFSRLGAGTQTGTETHPDRRHWRADALHWTAALSFSLATAAAYAGLARLGRGGRGARADRPAAAAVPAGPARGRR